MSLFNSIFNTKEQKAASKFFKIFDYDSTFVNITLDIRNAKDYTNMKQIMSSIKNFKERFATNEKVKDDVENLNNRLETKFDMLEAAGL